MQMRLTYLLVPSQGIQRWCRWYFLLQSWQVVGDINLTQSLFSQHTVDQVVKIRRWQRSKIVHIKIAVIVVVVVVAVVVVVVVVVRWEMYTICHWRKTVVASVSCTFVQDTWFPTIALMLERWWWWWSWTFLTSTLHETWWSKNITIFEWSNTVETWCWTCWWRGVAVVTAIVSGGGCRDWMVVDFFCWDVWNETVVLCLQLG